jgi:thiol-disulfide isomerase/thioredoxin
MGAVTLGPLVISQGRAYAALGFVVLIVLAEILGRRSKLNLADWGWRTLLVTFLGARLGFVTLHARDYVAEPWTALFFWQGGFHAPIGIAAGAAFSAYLAYRHPPMRRAIAGIGAAALLAYLLPTGLLSPAPASSGVSLPVLYLTDLDGGEVALAGSGRPTIVNVWATWCPPCRRELPLLTQAAAENRDVRILLINQRESQALVRGYLREQGLGEAGVLLDHQGLISTFLDVAGLPTTFAFDAGGNLVDVHLGEISAAGLRGMINRAR